MEKLYKAKYPVQTLEKAIDILIYLKEHPSSKGLSLNDLSAGLKMGKSNIHRFLDTLLEYNIVEKSENGTSYFLSWGLFELGSVVPQYRNISSVKIDIIIESLSDKFGEVFNLGVLNGNSMVIIKRFFPSKGIVKNKLITSTRVGDREPLFCTGIGKLFLSDMSLEDIKELFDSEPEKNFTQNTIKNIDTLNKEIESVQKNGYAIDKGESAIDVFCIAVPIRDYTNKIIAGISMSVPANRFETHDINNVIYEMKTSAGKISKFLGNTN